MTGLQFWLITGAAIAYYYIVKYLYSWYNGRNMRKLKKEILECLTDETFRTNYQNEKLRLSLIGKPISAIDFALMLISFYMKRSNNKHDYGDVTEAVRQLKVENKLIAYV